MLNVPKSQEEEIGKLVRGCCTQAVLALPLSELLREEIEFFEGNRSYSINKSLRPCGRPL